MSLYHVHFITHGDYIFGTTGFEAADDQAAIRQADKELRSGIGKGYEIWQGERLVHREIYRPPES